MAEHNNISVTVKSNSSLQTNTETSAGVLADEEQNEKANIPIQISESTTDGIPPNLHMIIENLNKNGGSNTNKADLLVSALYVLMIETGFIPANSLELFNDENIDFHKDRLLILNELPEKWKMSDLNSYKLNFILQTFPDYICKMTCLLMNTNLIVNLAVTNIGIFSIQFYINKYVPCDFCKKISLKFRYLDELSMLFKNEVALPAKYGILQEEGVSCANLQDLPTEILFKIFKKLDAIDFLKLISTCKRMNECAKFYEHNIWKYYFMRDFPSTPLVPEEVTWDRKYKEECLRRRKSLIVRNRFLRNRELLEIY